MPREPTKVDREDLKTGRLLEEMMATEGWAVYEKLLRNLYQEKIDQALRPISPTIQPDMSVVFPDGITHVLLGEAAKGAIIGIRLALELPRGSVLLAKELHRQLFPSAKGDDE